MWQTAPFNGTCLTGKKVTFQQKIFVDPNGGLKNGDIHPIGPKESVKKSP